ncbi:MAG TPA: UDP-N-acetylmuramate--L-alanine ligase [Rectinemataceae bacterium]|nr:UDP-N-acetylmuramate--L-alanine ligase [Rectinemataceae bacterium]
MNQSLLAAPLAGLRIHLVGAKGTGMAALAEILAARGALLSGSDVPDVFYTDAILGALGVPVGLGFEAGRIDGSIALVVHSAAYSRDSNPELVEARRRGIPILSYPEALGQLSASFDSSGIAGVHGKTTTTAMAGSIIAALRLPATILAGSAVAGFGGRSTLRSGDRYFVAETCEYRRNFLFFHPRRIVLTSIESDHQDYYRSLEDIFAAFAEYISLLPESGELIYCADDSGAVRAAESAARERPDLKLTAYGRRAEGPYRLVSYDIDEGRAVFRLAGLGCGFTLRVPGEHLALDASAALALAFSLLRSERHRPPDAEDLAAAAGALSSFAGSKRRSEILGEAGGVLFMDDYGHHPTAIRETLRGVKAFWPRRRLVVDFMSHTYSRTAALFDDFVRCLDEADVLVLHKIYSSAREQKGEGPDGRALYEALLGRRAAAAGRGACLYFEEPLDALDDVAALLRPGDLFLTMGAGDNWKLGSALYGRIKAF